MKKKKEITYCVYQIEICPTTKKRTHARLLRICKKITMGKVQNILENPTMHVEIRRAATAEEAIEYCIDSTKEEKENPSMG